MKILCPQGLHIGVFQGLNELCHHTFIVPDTDVHKAWDSNTRPQPSCVVGRNLDWNGDYDCVLVQSIQDWEAIPNKNLKPVIYYDLMNGRGNGPAHIYNHPNTILAFVSNSCRISHGLWDQVPHYVLYPGIDEDAWAPELLPGSERSSNQQIVHTRNEFSNRDTTRYNEWLNITTGMPHLLIGRGGDKCLNLKEMAREYITSRVYVNLEICTSTFSIAAMEAMMAGMPIVSNNIEGSGDYIRNSISGYVSNNIAMLRQHTQDLMNDRDMAMALGNEARKTAINMFGKVQFNRSVNYLFDNLNAYRK